MSTKHNSKITTEELWELKFAADRCAGHKEPFYFTQADAYQLRGKPKIIIIPGIGADDVDETLWYPWLKEQLKDIGIPVILTTFPQPMGAREYRWTGFVTRCIGVDENTILIGYNIGAVCALKVAEKHALKGIILLSAHHSDLGDEKRQYTGFFRGSWNWDAIKNNTKYILQLHSKDNIAVPVAEGRFVSEKVASDYHELDKLGNFEAMRLPEIIEIIKKKIQQG